MNEYSDYLVKMAIINNNTYDLNSFIYNCNGCFLIECIDSLCNLNENNLENNDKISIIIKETQMDNKCNYSEYIKDVNYLPIPHMLDSDWRFTKDSAYHILSLIEKYSRNFSNCLLVGTPSLFYKKEYNNVKNITFTLIENNQNTLPETFFFIKYNTDILKYNTPIRYDCIVSDPPWYINTIIDFVYKFSTLIKNNGILILTLPPYGVRKTITAEYEEIILKSEQFGFILEELLVNDVRYVTPPFELNTILSRGILNFPYDWRIGNILIFRKKEIEKERQVSHNFCNQNKSDWINYNIEKIRIKVKPLVKKDNNSSFVDHIYVNDILPTVSMRNNDLSKVNVWTSGNRVYKCNNTDVLMKLLKLRESNSFENTMLMIKDEDQNIIEFIENIIQKERAEYGKYW